MRLTLIALGIAVALLLPAARVVAQAPSAAKVWRIGYLTSARCPEDPDYGGFRFLEGLREREHVVGQTMIFECRRSVEGSEAKFRELASDLVRLRVDLIIGVSSSATRAVRPVTDKIPIVVVDLETDPVASGLAASLARPGGNITGIFLDSLEMNGKRLQLLREAVPGLSRVAALSDASMNAEPLRALETAARSLGVRLQMVTIRTRNDVDAALRTAAREKADGVVVMESALMSLHRKRIADVALQHRLPIIAISPPFTEDGGLMSYGPDVRHLFGQVASFVDRILKGARPGELPIERPTRFHFVVNLKTAKALGRQSLRHCYYRRIG